MHIDNRRAAGIGHFVLSMMTRRAWDESETIQMGKSPHVMVTFIISYNYRGHRDRTCLRFT
jgi:hypothetical protein